MSVLPELVGSSSGSGLCRAATRMPPPPRTPAVASPPPRPRIKCRSPPRLGATARQPPALLNKPSPAKLSTGNQSPPPPAKKLLKKASRPPPPPVKPSGFPGFSPGPNASQAGGASSKAAGGRRPSSPPPPPQATTASPKGLCTGPKVLQPGAVCGGINLCGRDGLCGVQCCQVGSRCMRRSAYMWRCEPVEP
jgi:hypothetical protein